MQKILMDIFFKYINLLFGEVVFVINIFLQQMGEFVDVDWVYIFDYYFEWEICINIYEWCWVGIELEIDNLQDVLFELLFDWVDMYIKGFLMYILDVFDLLKDLGIRQVLELQGIKSFLAVLFMNGEMCIGFVGFDLVWYWYQYIQWEIIFLKFFGQMLVNIQMCI